MVKILRKGTLNDNKFFSKFQELAAKMFLFSKINLTFANLFKGSQS